MRHISWVMDHISGPGGLRGEKAMETFLLALAFVGGLMGLVIVGMIGALYFYTHHALRSANSRRRSALQALTARSVPVKVMASAGQPEINLGLSIDSSSRYARGVVMVLASFLLLIVIAFISILISLAH
jgi:tetrahydromethanopterin S-methyltransferase subunit D